MSSLPAKPSQDAVWATSPGTDPTSGNSYLAAPSSPKQILGFILEKPKVQYFNWWMNLVYQWLIYASYRNERHNIVGPITASGAYAVSLGKSIYVWMNCTTGNQSVTLPTPVSGTDDGMIVRVKRLDGSGNSITWTGTIEGVTNPTIDGQYTEEAVIAFQGAWYWFA
jgi:hypothetical protein